MAKDEEGKSALPVSQARKEVIATLTPDEQLAFWNLLSEPVKLTQVQKKLGKLMRGNL